MRRSISGSSARQGWLRVGVFLALAAVLVTWAAALRPAPMAHAADSACGPGVNAIVCENEKPGTDPDIWDIDGAGDPSIQGFATEISVNVGERIDFKIDTDAAAYSIDIYRTGWYQGLGARKIASVTPTVSLPQTQPECVRDLTTDLYDCGTWGVSASWDVPSDAVSGVYIASLQRTDTGGQSHIIFVVRHDGNTSDVLFQTSDTTWQAYNTYGGASFYQGSLHGRAFKLSYNRPFATRGWVQGRDFYFSAEYATVRFLERNGYDISYIAGVDTDRRGGELLNHKAFLSVGHDEYWSGTQRTNVEAARDSGVHLQFLTGNEVYWRTRYEDSIDGSNTPYRTLVSYKETWGNAKIDPAPEWTGTWRDPRFASPSQGGQLPENSLTGTMYMVNDVDLPVTVSSDEGRTRLWRGTSLAGLAPGAQAELAAHTVGYEANEDIDNGHRPEGLIRLSTTVGPTPQYLTDYGNVVVAGTTKHHVTLYRAASGALVFSSASVQWGWGLDQEHDGNGAPADPRMQQAQINLFADMGVQPGSLMAGLVPASQSTDATPPTTVITSPAEGQPVTHGSLITVTGTAADADGQVAGVEVSVDGGQSWHPAEGTTSWSYSYIQQGSGSTPVIARAIDDSANFSPTGSTVTVEVTGPASAFGQAEPAIAAADDSDAYELGLRFTPASDGFVAGVRFFKGPGNGGSHVGSLWDASGTRLATVNFTDETESGWQEAHFLTPVEVTSGMQYTVSYTAPQGHYALTENYWPYHARSSSPITVTSAVGAAAPGVFGAPGTHPTGTHGESNYYVDVLFTESDMSPLRVANRVPAAGVSSVPMTTTIAATFTRPAAPESVTVTLTPEDGSPVPGTLSYEAATRTAVFTPASALEPRTTYTVDLAATDTAGVGLAPGSGWSFTTQGADLPEGECPCSLFPESAVPSIASASDSAQVTLGVRFTTEAAGSVTALKFYKGPANPGPHTATLWRADGTSLASVTFNDESTQGWQVAALDSPVVLEPGVEYVVSYLAPQGGYAVTGGRFASSYTRGPLTVPANGAVYTYSTGFPSQASTSDYGVDLEFVTSDDIPKIVSRTPEAGAVDVPAQTGISATFESAIQPGFTGKVVSDGIEIPGTWSLESGNQKATFVSSGGLVPGSQVVVTLTDVSSVEGTRAPQLSWSFSVASGEAAPIRFFPNAAPAVVDSGDAAGIELGMAFSSSQPGEVRAIRFYKSAANTGVHTGTVWGPSGQRLATVTFAGETPSGWQRAQLSQPVAIIPGVQYTVSYHAPNGHYSFTSQAFAAPVTAGPLTAASPDNGRFRYGDGGTMPTSTWNATNYFVDVEFVVGSGTPVSVVSVSPEDGSVVADLAKPVTATLSEDPGDNEVAITLTTPQGPVAGDLTYSSADRKLTFSPTGGLQLGTVYTAAVTLNGANRDVWTFSTADIVQSLFGQSTPQVNVSDGVPVELGTVFTVAEPGRVTAIRLYKPPATTGVHRGTLWDAAGQPLAQVNFAEETESGWQRAVLTTPVSVVPGTTYTVSYLSPSGRYAATSGYFAEARTSGFITGIATANGVFKYGADGGFPTESWASTAYFADVEIDFTAGESPAPLSAPESVAPSAEPSGPVPSPEPSGPVPSPEPSGPVPSPTDSSVVPQVVDVAAFLGDAPPTTDGAQVATRFTVDVAGQATGIRFYRGADTGEHTAYLWSAAGEKLAEVQVVDEPGVDWQTVEFAAPVLLQPGLEYRVGVHSTAGRSAVQADALAKESVSGPITIPTGGGAYGYGREFPATTSTHDFYVRVVFDPA